MMDFKQKLYTYAQLLIEHGLNVQKGQIVNITAEICHRELTHLLCQIAYRRGAKHVNVDFIEPRLIRTRLLDSIEDDDLAYVPHYLSQKYEEFVKEGAAVLRLIGSELPDNLTDLNPQKINTLSNSNFKALKKYYTEGVSKSKVQWTVAAAATPQWGKKVFPELEEAKACEALWEQIFKICRADQPNCLELWKKHNSVLQARAKHLTKMKIRELHFTGPDTDLKVFLSPQALFVGGGSQGPGGEFEPNIPTEECFTTPDYRLTAGKVKVTRPVLVNGKIVKDLHLEFKEGKLVHFEASEGEENFARYIDNDAGSRFLGEVALVGTDSPIFQTGKIFEEILYDENAACHIAVGFAYSMCIDGGPLMSPEQLANIGCNVSTVHVDMMISDEHVDVEATTYEGKKVKLICKGQWMQGL
ncbi:Aminopeptidase PepS [Neochlamydia sp. TUME1]|uniref:aminopeptidase n=1 Tax=Neochlamydia sp. TUME1 TaxID=1478174 RepID=UPI0005804582|nr:aminopeptidase [Neochlamydia sp. TUME1]KIC72811.1 Aminopeptidase PepS [Neochlamydia sp. TUME1]